MEAIISTERLYLRHWREEDADAMFAWAKDERVGLPAGWPPHTSVEGSRWVIQNVLNGAECYAICEKETDVPVGTIELKLNGGTDMTDRDDECELGYVLDPSRWGRGYMPEAGRAILDHAFNTLGMTTVWCGYYEGNTKSKRVQEKLGFRYHHTCDEVPVPALNEIRVGHTNVMTREMWEKQKEEHRP